MTVVSPSPKTMDRLRVLGEKELLGFIDEVKSKTNKELLRILPNVDGFRKDSVSSLPKRKRTMVAYFMKKGDTVGNKARADSAYNYFWRAWAEEHLPDVEGLADILSGIERAASKVDGTVTLDEAVEGLFRHLQEQSVLNRCSSETLNRLLLFSPFEITDTLERLVSAAKPLVAVERDRALSALPERLQVDEKLLERLQERFRKLEEEVAALSVAVKGTQVSTDPTNRIETLEKHVAELSRRLQQDAEERRQKADGEMAAAARLDDLERSTADLESLWAEMDDRLKGEAKEFQLQFAGLSDLLETMSKRPPIAASPTSILAAGTLQLTGIRERPSSVKALTDGSDAAGLLASNLAAIGLKASGTLTFAQELLTAVVTGRILFLAGSLAPEVARVLTHSLAAEHIVRARIPVGYVDASRLDEDTLHTLPADRDTAGALLLERVNNAPLEVLADSLAELARADSIFIVATLSEGLSALPDQPLYLQLGPVFDTDVLDWSIFAKSADMSAGALVTLDARTLGMALSSGKARSGELIQLLRTGLSSRNPRLERTAIAYLATLEGFRTQPIPTSLQSAAYGWAWPLWRMVDLPWDDRNERLDGGIVDGDEPDPRLHLLLELARPTGSQ